MTAIEILLVLALYVLSCIVLTAHIGDTFLLMTSDYRKDEKGYFNIANRYFARTIINGYLMHKKKLTIILLAPLLELYLQGCKLGFIIYKIKIKGNYADRISSWVI